MTQHSNALDKETKSQPNINRLFRLKSFQTTKVATIFKQQLFAIKRSYNKATKYEIRRNNRKLDEG